MLFCAYLLPSYTFYLNFIWTVLHAELGEISNTYILMLHFPYASACSSKCNKSLLFSPWFCREFIFLSQWRQTGFTIKHRVKNTGRKVSECVFVCESLWAAWNCLAQSQCQAYWWHKTTIQEVYLGRKLYVFFCVCVCLCLTLCGCELMWKNPWTYFLIKIDPVNLYLLLEGKKMMWLQIWVGIHRSEKETKQAKNKKRVKNILLRSFLGF